MAAGKSKIISTGNNEGHMSQKSVIKLWVA